MCIVRALPEYYGGDRIFAYKVSISQYADKTLEKVAGKNE